MKFIQRLKEREAKAKREKADLWKRWLKFIGGGITLLAATGTIVAAIGPWREWTTAPATASLVVPRAAHTRIDPKQMILLDNRFEQRIFYMIDKRSIDTEKPFLIGFPFSITNFGEKKLEKATVSFTARHTQSGLISNPPVFDPIEYPLFADIPMESQNFTGRMTFTRSLASTKDVAAISYNISELPPNQEAFFEFHIAPRAYKISVLEGGADVTAAIYDIKVIVISDGPSETQHFKLILLPSDDTDDFSVGVAAFTQFFGCKILCSKNWLTKQVHSSPWLAERFSTTIEDVLIKPKAFLASSGGKAFQVLKPENEITARRFVQVFGEEKN